MKITVDKNEKMRSKIVGPEEALSMLSIWHYMGLKVVFTNGCFDILHKGHVDYLSRAASLGDRMIVGLNSDKSVSEIKGPNRPIQDEASRAEIMASLFFVDAVVLFDEETPFNLINFLKPDILVKGSDYTIDKIVGADVVMANGGRVETINFIDGYSTTNIVNKIKNTK
jgi:rfaE bifunctional protein nucleotidyltransferase chain/domain